MKTIAAGFIFLMVLVLALVTPVSAEAAKHQLLAGFWMKQGTREAMLDLDTVDAGPFHHITTRRIARGITVRDDNGRAVSFKAKAVLVRQTKWMQEFRLTGFTLIKKGTRVRVTTIFFGLFDGDDWQHPHESGVCSSPSLSIEQCLGQWVH